MVKKIDKFPLLLFFIISAVLIFSWFRFGHMYGGGDTGLPTYNPKVMADISSNIWWESLSPGIPVAQGLTSVPMLYILSIPQMLGASPVIIQALLFFVLLFLMGYGMYLLALSSFGRSNNWIAIAAGVFYMFNPYMMIQIWHRFIHNSMFFVSFVPFIVMTWLWWLRKRKSLYLLLFLGVNFLAVYIFGAIAFIVTIWGLLSLLTLLEGIVPWKGKKIALNLFLSFLIGFIFWLLTNSWWLIPTFSVNPALFASQHSTDDSLATLLELSKQTVLPYTLRLINPFYLYWNVDFGGIYQNPFFLVISWLFVPIAFIGFIAGLKQKSNAVWSILFLIVIYLSKGAAPPFNFPYIFGFSHFFPLGVIRNPFEKLGVLLPLVYAVLFALGLQLILAVSAKFIGKFKTYILLASLISLHMVFFWPMFAGKLFGSFDKQNFVDVPQSYTQANDWIKQDISNAGNAGKGRILHLPLPQSEAVTYNWNYGYNGVDPSAAIFTSLPSIARGLDLPLINDALAGLSLIFHKPYSLNHDVILKMLQDFNVKYIILHKDIKWSGGELYNPLETEEVLDNLEFLDKKETFGDLIIYKLKDNSFSPKITISDNIELLYPSKKNLFWPWVVASSSAQIVNGTNVKQDENISDKANKIIVLAEKSNIVKNLEVPKFKGSLDGFNSIRVLPNSPFYFLIMLKERLSLIGKSQAEAQQMKMIFAEKRLVEAYKLKRMQESGIIDQKQGTKLILSSLNKYKSLLGDIFKNELLANNVIIGNVSFSITDLFLKHSSLLKEFGDNPFSNEIILLINKLLVEKGLLSLFPMVDENGPIKDFNIEHVFNILHKSSYELLMNKSNIKDIYPSHLSELSFQINGNVKKLQGEDKNNLMVFEKKEMDKGEYQISTPRIPSINLIPAFSQWRKAGNVNIFEQTGIIEMSSGEQSFSYIESEFKPAFGSDAYLFSFDLKILSGKGIRIEVIQDTDQIDKKTNETSSRYNNYYIPSFFDKDGWNHFEAITNLSSTTQKAKIKIQAEPWDDCIVVLADKKRCLDPKVKQLYNQPSKFIIKNVNVVRLLNNDIFLRASLKDDQYSTASGKTLEISRKSPSQYFGKVSITKPTFLFFKESFDPGWELKLIKNGQVIDNQIYNPTQHLIGNLYSNAYFIGEKGDYEFSLSYKPQRFIKVGIIMSMLGWVIVLIPILGYNFQRLFFKR